MGVVGCTPSSTTCVDWVTYATPQAAFDAARLVVIGTATPTETTIPVFGTNVPVYDISVSATLKGEAPTPLEIVAAPLTCTDSAPEDPLDSSDSLILLLAYTEGVWMTLTPHDGVMPMPDDGAIPFDTEGLFDLVPVEP